MAVSRLGNSDRITRQRRFLASGSWVVPAGVKSVRARIVGSGAAGRIAINVSNTFVDVAGSSGGCVIDAIVAVTPGASMPVTVAPTTQATVVSPGATYVDHQTYLTQGSPSSFGGVVAPGGIIDTQNIGLVSAGPGSGFGGGMWSGRDGLYDGAGDGIDFLGAGSGAFLRAFGQSSKGGAGGVASKGIFVTAGSSTQVTVIGWDAPPNSGAAGGPLSVANSGGAQMINCRAGNGGSGIVILEWEEYA